MSQSLPPGQSANNFSILVAIGAGHLDFPDMRWVIRNSAHKNPVTEYSGPLFILPPLLVRICLKILKLC